MIKNIVILVLLFLLGYGAYNKMLLWNVSTKKRVVTKTEIKEIIVRDTITVKEPKIVIREKYSPRMMPIYSNTLGRTTKDSIEVVLPVHRYSDRIEKDSSVFAYDIEVEGYLNSFNYQFDTYSKVITNTKTITNTRERLLDIYVVGGVARSAYIGVDVALYKYKVGYRFEALREPIHHVEFGYRIFDF